MPNKKKQRNPFFFFMKEMQEKLAEEGRVISMGRMQEHANPVWKQMSLAEKQKYEDMAKGYKIEYRAYGRLASDGTLIMENFEQMQREEDLEKEMRQGITDLLRVPGGSKEEFLEVNSLKRFFFVTFNILCHVEGGMYIPIEVGAAEYSIKDGFHGKYHKFIYPGPIPKGYTGDAKKHSEDTHGIPITGHTDSERDCSKIWKELMDFLNPPIFKSGTLPPVFCLKEDMSQTLGSLEWLAAKADAEEEFQDVKVWDASYLLMELRAGTECAAASYAVASEILHNNNFDYAIDSRCAFHEELDTNHCSLGYARRLCYLMADSLSQLFGVQVTERHLPLRSGASKPYETFYPSFQNLTLSTTNERGIGRGLPKVRNNLSSRAESSSSLHDRIPSRLHERTDSRLHERTDSRLHEKTDSRLHERIEPNHFAGNIYTASSNDESKSSIYMSDSDSENSPPGSSVENQHRIQTTPEVNTVTELRQPRSISRALYLARAAQTPAVAPGKGIGRGQRKLP